jgi:hypothetical protein
MAAWLHGCMGAWQVLIGPHGGNLQNMVFMRQPGTEGVADWTSDSTCVQLEPELFRVVSCVCVRALRLWSSTPVAGTQSPGPSGTCVVKRTLPVTVWLCLVIGLGLPAGIARWRAWGLGCPSPW